MKLKKNLLKYIFINFKNLKKVSDKLINNFL